VGKLLRAQSDFKRRGIAESVDRPRARTASKIAKEPAQDDADQARQKIWMNQTFTLLVVAHLGALGRDWSSESRARS
jgi:hypothetical protein